MSFLMPLIKNEWGLENMTISILTSLFYLGTSTGSVFTGKIADKKGRKICIMCKLYNNNCYNFK